MVSPRCHASTLATGRRPRRRRRARSGFAAALGAVTLALACRERTPPPQPVSPRTDVPTPAPDATDRCRDVGTLRVCWGAANAPAAIVVTSRPVPEAAPTPLGYRCTGAGTARVCRSRALDAEEFRCTGDRCVQRHPRLPDSGEWECADIAGALFCHGGERAAGVPPGASARGFDCAPSRAAAAERVCVDFSPDFPDGHAASFRCHFEDDGGLVRVCERDASAHLVGDSCDAGHPCILGLACAGGPGAPGARCVPPGPEPACFADGDCDQQVCRFGTCTTGTP